MKFLFSLVLTASFVTWSSGPFICYEGFDSSGTYHFGYYQRVTPNKAYHHDTWWPTLTTGLILGE